MSVSKFLGNLGGYAYLRDPRHTAKNFGLTDATFVENVPRQKFQFFLRFNFTLNEETMPFINDFFDNRDVKYITTLVKTADLPSVNIDTDVVNQYNKKRISQTKINFEPVSFKWHDVIDGKTLRMWEMYYEYYFRDGITANKLEFENNTKGRKKKSTEFEDDIIPPKTFNGDFGYNLKRVGRNRYLIDSIDIFQVHGGRLSRIELVHPRISSFKHDTLDFADSNLVEISTTFEYEDIIYQNNYDVLTDEELDYFRNGDYLELDHLDKLPIPVRQRNLEARAPFPSANVNTLFNAAGGLLTGQDPTDIARSLLQESGALTTVQGALNDVIGDVQSSVVESVSNSSSIFDGQINLGGGG